MVNFMRGTTLLAQARATALTSSSTLTVPFPTPATSITPNLPGLSAGPVQAQVWQQTGSAPTFSLIGSAALTVTDTRPVPGVSGITPSSMDLATPPASFTSEEHTSALQSRPHLVCSLMLGTTLIAQARATALTVCTPTAAFPPPATP